MNNPGELNPYDLAYLATIARAVPGAGMAAQPLVQPLVSAGASALGANAFGVAGLNAANAIGAGFATHGAMNIGPDTSAWIDKPSWEKAGAIGWDVLDMAPAISASAKTIGEGFNLASNAAKSSVNTKVIPGIKPRSLPEKLVPIIEHDPTKHTHTTIRFKDPKNPHGTDYGYLGLENKTEWLKDANGEYIRDVNGMPQKSTVEWLKPSMISVDPKLQGNRLQDVLYQLGIDEAYKQKLSGIISGETLLSPQKTSKAHERFNRIVFDSKLSFPREHFSTRSVAVPHDIVGLTGHKNPNVVSDWMNNYKTINKHFPRRYHSLKDIANAPLNWAKNNKESAFLAGAGSATLGSIGYLMDKVINNEDLYGRSSKEVSDEFNEEMRILNLRDEIDSLENNYKSVKNIDTKQVGGELTNELPKAQFGEWFDDVKNKVTGYFNDEPEVKKVVRPIPVERTLHVRDPRTIRATSGRPMRPTSDILTGDYNSVPLDKTLREAKRQGLSKEDMWNLSSMALAEAGLGKKTYNIGQVTASPGEEGTPGPYEFVHAYIEKMKDADRLNLTDPAARLQIYNGNRMITPKTERKLRGYDMNMAYGVPIPKEGISMKKRPLYGINVLDVKNNVIKKNPEFVRYIDSIYKAPVYQGGGEKTVKYGTPEYEAAYNRGEVITEDGQRSPIALDEVVVQNNYKRPRGFWEQYRDKIVDENKDSELLGAVIGTPISAITSLPQLAMMKGITGKMERPSKAWGFNNQERAFKSPISFGKHASNFVLDAVTDPFNLVVAGALSTGRNLSKFNIKNAESFTNSFANPVSDLKTLGQSYINRNKPLYTIGANNLEQELIKKIKQLESPEGFKRLAQQEAHFIKSKFPNLSESEILKKANNNAQTRISELYQTTLKGNVNKNYIDARKLNSELLPRDFDIPMDNASFRRGSMKNEIIDLQKHKYTTDPFDNSIDVRSLEQPGEIRIGSHYAENLPVYDHEINHALQNGDVTAIDEFLANHFKNPENVKVGLTPKKKGTTLERDYRYLLKGSNGKEPSSFLAEVRRSMLERGIIKDIYEPITEDIINKAFTHFEKNPFKNKMTNSSSTRIFDVARNTPQNRTMFSQMMNKLPAVLPVGLGIGAASQLGNQEQNTKLRQGGYINDKYNLRLLNPETY
jgi:hypothetical protein